MNERMKARRKNRLPEGDDGRTIVSMNVDGMPWYTPGQEARKTPESEEESPARPVGKAALLTREETRYYTFGALKAALAVVGVICLGIILFVLFCQYVWFQ